MQCLAWTLMSNHYHLLVRVGSDPLAKLMAPLLGGYASSYNRRHNRCGYVFQNRYKSILCDADNYLLELVRYIHLNPLRAGIVANLKSLDFYPWTGHAGLMGKKQQVWQSVNEVMVFFGDDPCKAREMYRNFVSDGIEFGGRRNLTGGGLIRSYGGWENLKQLRKEHTKCIGDERILGDSKFVKRALAQDELTVEKKEAYACAGWTLGKLVEKVCLYCNVREVQLYAKARSNNLSKAKSLICYWGVEELGISHRELSKRLSISQPAISLWVKKGRDFSSREGLVFAELSVKLLTY